MNLNDTYRPCSWLPNNRWVVSIISGLMMGLSFSPFPFPMTLLVIPGFAGLLYLTRLASSARQMAWYCFAGLLAFNLLTTYWLMFATVAGGIAAILANSAIMTLPMMLIWHTRRYGLPWLPETLLVASIWVAYEFLHFRWDLSWPWLSLGNSFATAPWLVQYISVTGILGISFWIVLLAWMMIRRTPLAAILLAGILPTGGSLIYYTLHDMEAADEVEIAIMQPNFDSYLHLAGYSNAYEPLELILSRSEKVITDHTRAIFWPENAIMTLIRHEQPGRADQMIRNYVDRWQIPLVAGSAFKYRYENGKEPPVVRGKHDHKYFNIYNAALGFYPDGSLLHYKKAKLVPMVERIPFLHTLRRMDRFDWINWEQLAMFGKGDLTKQFMVDEYSVPALICYDSVYPDWVRRFTLQGAAFLVVITNDGWWGRTSGHIQHFDFARLRAIENRRSVVRSANNGLSGVILANGDVVHKTSYWVADQFVYSVPVHEAITIYARWGDWVGWLASGTTLFSVLVFFGSRKMLPPIRHPH